MGKKWPVTEPPTPPTWTGTDPLQTMVVRILGANKHSHWPRGVCKRSVKPLVWSEPPNEYPYKTSKTECVAGVRTISAATAADGEKSQPRRQGTNFQKTDPWIGSVVARFHQTAPNFAVSYGACQATCRLIHAANRRVSLQPKWALMTQSRSGFSVTAPTGDQLRVSPDQRAGFFSRACKYSAWRAARMA